MARQVIEAAPKDTEIDWDQRDVQVRWDGDKITLPVDSRTGAKMDYDPAIETLARVRDQENQEFQVNELVRGAPWDSLVATYKAMQELFGAVTSHGLQTFFGKMPPKLITIDTGPGPRDKIQVPIDLVKVPGFDKDRPAIEFYIQLDPKGCRIHGELRKKERELIVQLAVKAREILSTDSVYRGKALNLNVDRDGDLILTEQPTFIDLSKVQETDIIHTPETELMIKTSIFGPLKNTAACRKNNISLKRGNLLVGKYGTGKSLTAMVSAKVAVDNGWTFLNIKDVSGLKAAIEFAKLYQPCMIFAEDIDRATDNREDEAVNQLVNLMDGMIGKRDEIMIVLTTNFVDRIDKAFIRPGRLDAIIKIEPPDAQTAGRLIRHYAGDQMSPDEDISKVSEAVKGYIPATIREVVDRAKLLMLVEDRSAITGQDLYGAALTMKYHMDLLEPAEVKESPQEKLWNAFRQLVTEANVLSEDGDEDTVLKRLSALGQRLDRKLGDISDASNHAAMASTIAAANTRGGGNGKSNGSAKRN